MATFVSALGISLLKDTDQALRKVTLILRKIECHSFEGRMLGEGVTIVRLQPNLRASVVKVLGVRALRLRTSVK